jgi:hypothetical protein
VVIGASFLPYLSLEVAGQDVVQLSGYSMVETLLSKFEIIQEGIDSRWADMLWNSWMENADGTAKAGVAGFLLVMAGPFIFTLYALGYVFRGLAGKQYKRGIFFTLLFLGASWAIFYFLSKPTFGFEMSFFKAAGPGFWVAFGGMLAAAFSLFFERGGKKAKV